MRDATLTHIFLILKHKQMEYLKPSNLLSKESKKEQFGLYIFLKNKYNLKLKFEAFLISLIKYIN